MNFVLDLIAKPTIVLLCAAVVTTLLRRASASLRHAVWILAIASAIVLPTLSSVIPHIELPVPVETDASVTFFPLYAGPEARPTGAPAVTASTSNAAPAGLQLLAVWLGGVVLVLARLLAGTIAVRRTSSKAVPVVDHRWLRLSATLSAALGIRRPVRLLLGGPRISPVTWGVFRHTVLLPSKAVRWSDERRRLVLAHELAHVKRMDGAAQVFLQIVCSIYWFNPLVWYAAHRLRIERERACDDRVLGLGTAAVDYADHLIQIVRGMRSQQSFAFTAVSMAQPSQLETRLISILDGRLRRRKLSRIGTALICALTTLLTLSIGALGVATAVPLPPVLVAAMRMAPAPAPPPAMPAARPAAAPQRTRIGNAGMIPSTTVVPPAVVSSKPPIYTTEALMAGIEGIVTLEAAVDLQGGIRILRVVKELGYGLDQRAMGAVLDWKFAPATRNGVAVESITQIDVEFKLPPRDPGVHEFTIIEKKGLGLEPPTVISRVEPQYSPEAREKRYQGTVRLQITVNKDGTVTVNRVVTELGLGLDEKAVEALQQWKFRPAMRNGEPVSVTLNVEVHFNLK